MSSRDVVIMQFDKIKSKYDFIYYFKQNHIKTEDPC